MGNSQISEQQYPKKLKIDNMAQKKDENSFLPTNSDVKLYEMLYPMLVADLEEIRELSKKKPDGLLNPLKVKTINKKLEKVKAILSNEPTTDFLELLDEETLPSNSDAVLLVLQFKTALEQFKSTYFGKNSSYEDRRWFTKENPGIHYKK